MIKRVIAILLLCTAYSLSFAQTSCPYIWTGQIQSAATKLPVANATVILQPAGRSVMTDAKGYYRLTSVCAGTYTLHISSVGYEAFQSDQIVLSKDKSQDFTLRPSNIHLDDVEVVGVSNTALSGSKHRLSAQDLSETKGKLFRRCFEQDSRCDDAKYRKLDCEAGNQWITQQQDTCSQQRDKTGRAAMGIGTCSGDRSLYSR